jgi:hypothetical protein
MCVSFCFNHNCTIVDKKNVAWLLCCEKKV